MAVVYDQPGPYYDHPGVTYDGVESTVNDANSRPETTPTRTSVPSIEGQAVSKPEVS